MRIRSIKDYNLMNIDLHGTELDNAIYGEVLEAFFKALGIEATALIYGSPMPKETYSRWKLIWMLLYSIFRPYKWKPVNIKGHSPNYQKLMEMQREKYRKRLEDGSKL